MNITTKKYLKEETMIVLNVTYKCKPDMRQRFLEAIINMANNRISQGSGN